MSLQPTSPAGPHSDDVPSFAVHIDTRTGEVRLAGRLDRSTTHLFIDAITALLYAGCPSWVVDTGDLHSCDATGLRAISATYRRALRHGRLMTLVSVPAGLQRALRHLHLDTHLLAADPEPHPDREPVPA